MFKSILLFLFLIALFNSVSCDRNISAFTDFQSSSQKPYNFSVTTGNPRECYLGAHNGTIACAILEIKNGVKFDTTSYEDEYPQGVTSYITMLFMANKETVMRHIGDFYLIDDTGQKYRGEEAESTIMTSNLKNGLVSKIDGGAYGYVVKAFIIPKDANIVTLKYIPRRHFYSEPDIELPFTVQKK